MKLLVKEIDSYKSSKFKGKVIAEFIVYVMADETPTEAYTVFGKEAVNNKVIELMEKLSITVANTSNN